MELYKIAELKYKNYSGTFDKDFIEFLSNEGYIYNINEKKDKITVYGINANIENKYPTEEQLQNMVDNYISNINDNYEDDNNE